MKILLTGGAGFMGSNMIHYILKKYPSYEIINLDKLTYAGNLDNLIDVENNPNYTFIKGDIADANLIKQIFSNTAIDVVLNYAAETHVDRSIQDPSAFLNTEIIGTYNLLEAVKTFNVNRMIQVSTDEVYGSIKEGAFTEESPLKPNNPYSAAKAGADHLCAAYHKTYKTPVIVTHSCNYIGEYQHPEKFIPLFITNLLEGKKVPIYGDGMQVREWIYTKDHCDAIDILVHRGLAGEVYNIGSQKREHNIEVVKLMLKLLNLDESSIEFVRDRAGHDVRYAVNCDKLMKEYDWKPKFSFMQALENTINWYKENEWWWKKIKYSDSYQKYYEKQYVQREKE